MWVIFSVSNFRGWSALCALCVFTKAGQNLPISTSQEAGGALSVCKSRGVRGGWLSRLLRPSHRDGFHRLLLL